MSAIANIVINDGQATPVAHTFYPNNINGTTAKLRENQASLPLIGQGTLEITVRDLKSGVKQVHVTLATPALETATAANSSGYTAAPKVAYVPLAGVTFNFDQRTTLAQRKDLRVLLANALLNAIVVDAIDNLNPPY